MFYAKILNFISCPTRLDVKDRFAGVQSIILYITYSAALLKIPHIIYVKASALARAQLTDTTP